MSGWTPDPPTIGGIPVQVGEIYYTRVRNIPRKVVRIEGATVYVKRPDALDTSAWPVKYFARNYCRKRANA